MSNSLDGLRHNAVIRRDHEDHNVGHLRAARPHRRKRGVARCVEEGNQRPAFGGDLVRTDMLGDPAGLARDHIGLAERVKQRGLAVVDMTHDGHNGCTRFQRFVRIIGAFDCILDIGVGHANDLMSKLFDQKFCSVLVDGLVLRRHNAVVH